MSGGKKNKQAAAVPEPAALPGPTLNVPPAPTNVPGHLELLSQQINQGYPSLGQADTLKHLQNVYKPAPGPDAATAAAVAQSKAGTGSANQGAGSRIGGSGYRGGMINSFGEFFDILNQASMKSRGKPWGQR